MPLVALGQSRVRLVFRFAQTSLTLPRCARSSRVRLIFSLRSKLISLSLRSPRRWLISLRLMALRTPSRKFRPSRVEGLSTLDGPPPPFGVLTPPTTPRPTAPVNPRREVVLLGVITSLILYISLWQLLELIIPKGQRKTIYSILALGSGITLFMLLEKYPKILG